MSQSPDEILDEAQDHHVAGRLVEAVELYRKAIQTRPDDASAVYFLGLALFQLRRPTDAVDLIRRAIALDPAIPEYHCDLARILFDLNDLSGAIFAARDALQLRPDLPHALFILGNALCRGGRLEEGIDAYQRLISLTGHDRDAVNNLGMALLDLGRIDQAIACFDQILASNPNDAPAHSNRVYAMHFSPASSAASIREALVQWNHRHALPLKPAIIAHDNDRAINRPLRIGYVSPDFRQHVVGWNMLSWLPRHDSTRFIVSCYSSVRTPDAITRQLQSHVHSWRDVAYVPDEQVAQMIRNDRIDILVDLSLHTSGNRLLVFARKPAPIQVSYLGYPGSTGLEAMDYRFSDPFLDSPQEQLDHTERTICLPQTYWCYKPGGPTPDVVKPPALSTGVMTFGCLNQFQKVSAEALDAWRQIMRAIATSRLVLHAPAGKYRDHILKQFDLAGVAPHRIEFVERLPWPQYISTYQRIDIALDPFPYGGGITTCDAAWMGVPVITLRGKTSVGRSGASILQNLNLTHCIAESVEDYISAATTLAGNITLLCDLRSGLRGRMLASPLMNDSQFARDIEAAFRQMWSRWANSTAM